MVNESKETAVADNDKDSFDVNEEELLLMLLIKMAPDAVRVRALQRLRELVSIKTADAAAALMAHVEISWDSTTEMLTELKSQLIPELQGPTAPIEDPLKQLLGAIYGVSPENIEKAIATKGEEGGYRVPTPGCSCARCQYILEKEKAGIRIRTDGTEESPKEMN